jgi:hypothetical protein
MKRLRRWPRYALGGALLAVGGTFALLIWVAILTTELRALEKNGADNQAALNDIKSRLADLKDVSPGLGEFMTTMQLHMAKLWFAGKAANWGLAKYELDELRETVEGAQTLHAKKNGVDISNVLASVVQTQISPLSDSINRRNQNAFTRAYDDLRTACNGCHEESGHRFIAIIRPSAPPVSNQKWDSIS